MLAIKCNVKIGAHPSYPDKINFGRKSMNMMKTSFIQSIFAQVELIQKIVKENGANLNHIKAHGALYNDLVTSEKLCRWFLQALECYKENVVLFVPFNSKIEKNALKRGFRICYEAFADRNYNDDLSLVPRDLNNAVLTNPTDVYKHTLEIFEDELVTSISGKRVSLKGETFCVHSDTPNVVQILQYFKKNPYKTNNEPL